MVIIVMFFKSLAIDMIKTYNLAKNTALIANSHSKVDITHVSQILFDNDFYYIKSTAIDNNMVLDLNLVNNVRQIQYKQWKAAPLFTKGQGIVIIGGSGAGKTTLAKHLAYLLDLPFIDSDELIQARRKETIANIFLCHEEIGFRFIEACTIRECMMFPSVVSIGAGAWENAETRKAIQQSNFAIIWLAESPDKAWARVKNDLSRPLVTTYDRFLARWALRTKAWSQARAVIPTEESSFQLAEALIKPLSC